MTFRKRLFVSALCLAPLFLGFRAVAVDTNVFGFTGPEIFPIDPQIESLHVADIDGDGLNDIIVANNSRSKITILYNQTGKTNLTKKASRPGERTEINELPPD